MTKFKLAIATAALCVGGLSGFALAHGGHHGGKARMAQFDTNKDGKLDEAEKAQRKAAFAARKAEKLARFDANKDGQLDDAERRAMHDERVAQRFAALDLDKNGAITLDEMKAAKPHHRGHRTSK